MCVWPETVTKMACTRGEEEHYTIPDEKYYDALKKKLLPALKEFGKLFLDLLISSWEMYIPSDCLFVFSILILNVNK